MQISVREAMAGLRESHGRDAARPYQAEIYGALSQPNAIFHSFFG